MFGAELRRASIFDGHRKAEMTSTGGREENVRDHEM